MTLALFLMSRMFEDTVNNETVYFVVAVLTNLADKPLPPKHWHWKQNKVVQILKENYSR